MALTIPSATLSRSSHHSLAVIVRRWAVRLILAVLLAILALLAFGALSAAAPMAHHAASHLATAGAGVRPLCNAGMWGC